MSSRRGQGHAAKRTRSQLQDDSVGNSPNTHDTHPNARSRTATHLTSPAVPSSQTGRHQTCNAQRPLPTMPNLPEFLQQNQSGAPPTEETIVAEASPIEAAIHQNDKIVINGNKCTAYIADSQIKSTFFCNKNRKKVELLSQLVDFNRENHFTRIPKEHPNKRLYNYTRNILASLRAKYEGLPEIYKLWDFEKRCLTKLKICGENARCPFASDGDKLRAKKFIALCKGGESYVKKYKHFRIFGDSQENSKFEYRAFTVTPHITQLCDIFLEVRGRKKLGKMRIEKLKECLGFNIMTVDISSLGLDCGGDREEGVNEVGEQNGVGVENAVVV